jgi:catechol 2,3-dioxygenase-like lactoylglutathione lyase family enzyme
MLDHFSISVKDYPSSLQFYDETLKLLGYKRIMTIDINESTHTIQCAGYGEGEKPSFWISPMGEESEDIGHARGVHIAFKANSPEEVTHWYKKCLEMGGMDNGAPGPRPHYHPGYYGAFIVDPNGWRIEAACHTYKG